MKIVKIIIVWFVMFSVHAAVAQNFSWMNSAGGVYDDFSGKVVRGTNNFFFYGNFEDSVTITNTQSGTPIHLGTRGWGSDIFLMSVDTLGDVIWAKSLGGIGYDSVMGSIRFNEIDSTILLMGEHSSNFYYGPNSADFIGLFNGAGKSVAFLKIKENGDVVSAHTTSEFGVGAQFLEDVQERDSSIFLSARVVGDLTFSKKDGSGDTTIIGPAIGGPWFFVVSLDKNLKFNFLTVTPHYIYKMEFDSIGNIYGIGSYDWCVDPPVYSTWYINTSLIKLSPNGTLKFAKPIKTESVSYAKYSYLNIISDNNISFTTHSSDTTLFDSLNLYTSPLCVWNTHPQFEFFSLRLDSLGNVTDIIPYELGTGMLRGVDFNMNALGETYFTMPYTGTVSVNANTYTSNGGTDVLLYAFDVNANINWVQSFGSTGNDYCNSITFDDGNNPVLHGTFESSITVTQPGFKKSSPVSINSNGGKDVFYAKINRTTVVPASIATLSKSNIIKVFPSPASSKMYIKIDNGEDRYNLDVFNSLGQLVLHQSISSNITEIDVTMFNAGIYTYRVHNNNFSQCDKILIQH